MVNITLNTKTRNCIANTTFLGYEGENNANKLIFTFDDLYVDGFAQINIKRGNDKGYVNLTKVEETYELEVKSSLVSQIGDVTFQLQITKADGTIYKYDAFVMTVKDAIDTDTPMPEDYPSWIEEANIKLAEIDEATAKANNTLEELITAKENGEFNGKDGYSPSAKVEPTENGVKITITDKDGTTEAEVLNGTGGNGEGGTTDYNDLTNKPKINNVELTENQTLEQLGIKQNYTKSDVGLENVDNIKQYSINNPPPYPVTSVNGKVGDVNIAIPAVPTKTSQLTNDSGYITEKDIPTIDLSDVATKEDLTSKVDKETGKSLIADSEIERLKDVKNYDDTEIKQSLNNKADTSDIPTKISDLTNDSEFATKTQLLGKVDKWSDASGNVTVLGQQATTGFNPIKVAYAEPLAGALTTYQLGGTISVNSPTQDKHAANKKYVDTKIADLINSAPDTLDTLGEIATAIKDNEEVVEALNDAIGKKVDKVDGKGLSTNDFTTDEKVKLGNLTNYDDTELKGLINNKVDKVTGKGLSTNDYTTSEKNKLAGLSNYDDTEIRNTISSKASIDEVTNYIEEHKDELKGEPGKSGVYVGSGDMPEGYNVQIDTTGEATFDVVNKGASYFSLPNSVNIKVNSEFRVYFRNVISLKTAQLWIGSNSNLTTRYYDDYFSIIPTTEGSHNLSWKLYDERSNLLESGVFTVNATTKNASLVTKALVIGDSTVNAGIMTQKAQQLYISDGAKLSLLGTRGTSPNLHEGRGGWTAANYCNKASDGTYDNPFYNNGFDFSYYMANQGYTGLQAVVIQLGINDVFLMKDTTYTGDTVIGYINQMVTSILNYDSTLKVIINLPITPNSNGTSFTEAYGTTQLYWLYNRNSIRFSQELRDYFKDNANVSISASNCILDTKTEINDGVHPTTDGYNALGQRLYEVLVNIVDGVVASLFSVKERAYVVNTSTTIGPTDTHDLDTTKCFSVQLGGTRSSQGQNDTYEALSDDSLAYTTPRGTVGSGAEFPLDLKVGNTYKLHYNASLKNARVYLQKYNTDTTYNSNIMLSSEAGEFTKTITPEEGYIYTILFTPLVANTRCVWSDIAVYAES